MENAQSDKAELSAPKQRNFSSKSTSTEDQQRRTLDALKRGPKTSHDLRRLGVYHVAGRIAELRHMGYQIDTQRVTLIDSDGYSHVRAGRYVLIAEPEHVEWT